MKEYICPRCKKKFNRKSNYDRHNNRQKICEIKKDPSILVTNVDDKEKIARLEKKIQHLQDYILFTERIMLEVGIDLEHLKKLKEKRPFDSKKIKVGQSQIEFNKDYILNILEIYLERSLTELFEKVYFNSNYIKNCNWVLVNQKDKYGIVELIKTPGLDEENKPITNYNFVKREINKFINYKFKLFLIQFTKYIEAIPEPEINITHRIHLKMMYKMFNSGLDQKYMKCIKKMCQNKKKDVINYWKTLGVKRNDLFNLKINHKYKELKINVPTYLKN